MSSLYTNINPEEGIEEIRKFLLERESKSVPTEFLVRMLDQVLNLNIFEFDSQLYKQIIGTAMGTICAPPYANVFMHKIDGMLKTLATNLSSKDEDPIRLLKRFLDDIFLVWRGTVDDLQLFLEEMNKLHPTIKFTSEMTSPYRCDMEGPHDCFCHQTQSIAFLDTKVSISGGNFVTDLFKKPTDRCQYLLPSSCHPSHITKNIPYNLCHRLLRICSNRETLKQRLNELKELLLSREYRKNVVEDAIKKVLEMSREEALKEKTKIENKRTLFDGDQGNCQEVY